MAVLLILTQVVEVQVAVVAEARVAQVINSSRAEQVVVEELRDKAIAVAVAAGGQDQIHQVVAVADLPVLVLVARALTKMVPDMAVQAVQEQLVHSQVVQ
jgi:hypothetical protein